jgi:hypothetical protein
MDSVVSRTPARDLLAALLHDAGVGARSAIRVAGKSGLSSLIWLCRHGFDDVAYVRASIHGPSDPGDALLVLHIPSPAELEALLAEAQVREGGVAIVQTPHLGAPGGPDPVQAVLARAGYRVERRLDRRSGDVYVARRTGGSSLKRAA